MRPVHVVVTLTVLALVAPAFALGPVAASTSAFVYTTYSGPAPANGAGEPSIGVNPHTGKVFFQDFATTWRVDFDDSALPAVAAWDDVTPPNSIYNVDPILFTDQSTGRTWAGGLAGQCSVLAFTDDDGASWTPTGNACASPAFDHQSIGSGAWSADPTSVLKQYSRAFYYCAQAIIIECATSYDGGLTFAPPVPFVLAACNGLHGSLDVASNGVAILPIRTCGSAGSGLAFTATNGRIWSTKVFPGGRQSDGFDPDVATTPSNWVYAAYAAANGSPHVLLYKNVTKPPVSAQPLGPWDIGAAVGIKTTAFIETVAGDDDRAAVAFMGTTTPGNAFAEGFPGEWHIYVATTLDQGATWDVVKVTDDPVQRGWICAQGVECSGGRNLLDFFDAQIDEEGRVLVGFADGCVGPCALPGGTSLQSMSDHGTIARQTCGSSLYAAMGNVEGARPCDLAPPVPPVPLTGTYYASSALPIGNAGANPGLQIGGQPDADSRVLTPEAPTSPTSSVSSSFPLIGSTVTGNALITQWAMAAPASGWVLQDATVTVRLFVASEGINAKFNVSLYDAGIGLAASTPTPSSFASRPMSIGTASPAPVEVIVTFTGIDATLTRGFAVVVENLGGVNTVDTQVYYGSTTHPTSVKIE